MRGAIAAVMPSSRRPNCDIAVSILLALALPGCDDTKPKHCNTGGACSKEGEMCAGFESDFECVGGAWKCVPSGRVGDPCVAPDAPTDAHGDAPRD